MKKLVSRRWGHYKVLHEGPDYVVKELVINPGCGISYQRHENRSEFWYVRKGVVSIKYAPVYAPRSYTVVSRCTGDSFTVPIGSWHQAYNDGTEPVHMVECQAGICDEDDIERLSYYEDEQ